MASLRQLSFVFFILMITFFLVSAVLCESESETLIERICRQPGVESYEFCKNRFKNRVVKDIFGLTKITIQETYSTGTYVRERVFNLLNRTTDPSTKKTLLSCKDGYDLVIRQFGSADGAFEKHEYKDALDAESATKSALVQCKSEEGGIVEGNKETRTLIAMSLASLDILLQTKNPSYPR